MRDLTAAWYRREISVPKEWTGRRIALSAAYVNSVAIIFVDGVKRGPRGGAGLRKAVMEQAKMPVLCYDGGLTYLYVDGDTDIPMAQNLTINSKAQLAGAANSLDTLLVQQFIGRQFLPPLINRLLDEFKIEVRGCPKTIALMGQMGRYQDCAHFQHIRTTHAAQ